MKKIRHGKTRITSSLFAVALLCAPGMATAMGYPLLNLRLLFEDSVRVHIDDLSLINQRSTGSRFGDLSESEVESRISIHPTHPEKLSESSETCNDYKLTDYGDWLVGHERAKAARSEATSNLVTSEMKWPGFLLWSSPSFAYLDIQHTFLGNLKSADLVLAVVGNDFDINPVFDLEEKFFTQDTIRKLVSVRGYGYESMLEYQLKGKKIQLDEKIECDGFQLFIMSVD